MSEQKKAWIYCRISEDAKNELLAYQVDLLTDYAHKHNYAIVGSTTALDSGKSIDSLWMQYLIKCVVSEWMDCILVYSNNRLLTDPERLEEFELICRIHNVSIISIK